ncbi:MAG TPA: sensor histidine kinase, partial [Hyalangium sp.]|nr:sensor histidine kinase [Hyalangium sp.]
MLRRLLPTLLALGCGLLALGWGLVSLQRLFAQETEDARTQLRSHREELARYATEALRQKLRQRLAENLPAIYKAVEDPLVQADGLYLFFRQYQFLPRLPRPRPGARIPAVKLYAELHQRLMELSAPGPWQERLDMVRSIKVALAQKEPQRAEQLLETLLRHRAEHPLPAAEEIPYTLLVIDQFSTDQATSPLVRGLLGGGLADEFGGMARGAGLQRDLLRECQRFTQADFDFLSERIIKLSTEF